MSSQKNGLNTQSYPEDKVDQAFPIVGIGASAGGLDPITKLLETFPLIRVWRLLLSSILQQDKKACCLKSSPDPQK